MLTIKKNVFQKSILERIAQRSLSCSISSPLSSTKTKSLFFGLRVTMKLDLYLREYRGYTQNSKQRNATKKGAKTIGSGRKCGYLSRCETIGPIMIATNKTVRLDLKSLTRMLSV